MKRFNVNFSVLNGINLLETVVVQEWVFMAAAKAINSTWGEIQLLIC